MYVCIYIYIMGDVRLITYPEICETLWCLPPPNTQQSKQHACEDQACIFRIHLTQCIS